MTNVEAFKLELCQRLEALPRVNRVEFIGLVANGDYVASSSGLDVLFTDTRYQGKGKNRSWSW